MKAFTDQEVNKLLSFIGYGDVRANVWFIGMEEGGGDEENLRRRLNFEKVEDCRDAMEKLGIRDWHWGTQRIQRTWRGMCHIMLVLGGVQPSREEIRKYQVEMLGRAAGDTLLTELMPIPKPRLNTWTYSELFPQFGNAEEYYSEVKPGRIKMLRNLFETCKPEIVICYGKKFHPDFLEIFPLAGFERVNGLFSRAHANGSKIFLTDHFTARSMNTGLDSIAQAIKSEVSNSRALRRSCYELY